MYTEKCGAVFKWCKPLVVRLPNSVASEDQAHGLRTLSTNVPTPSLAGLCWQEWLRLSSAQATGLVVAWSRCHYVPWSDGSSRFSPAMDATLAGFPHGPGPKCTWDLETASSEENQCTWEETSSKPPGHLFAVPTYCVGTSMWKAREKCRDPGSSRGPFGSSVWRPPNWAIAALPNLAAKHIPKHSVRHPWQPCRRWSTACEGRGAACVAQPCKRAIPDHTQATRMTVGQDHSLTEWHLEPPP